MWRRLLVFCLVIILAPAASLLAAGRARYFVLVVWDGMRPDYVSAELTPSLQSLRDDGVWFGRHHSVYPTSTEVNGTVLATGVFPRRSGISANKEYRREIDPLKQFGTESLSAVRRGDELTGGKYVRVPTVAELVQVGGGRTTVVGAKPIALLHDRRLRPETSQDPVWFAGATLPQALLATLTNRFGKFPAVRSPDPGRDTWATRCLIEAFWEKELPRYSVLWLSEPDYAQHKFGPGSREARSAIRHCDDRLAAVLNELDRRGVRAETDVFVVSDHGFSTIAENNDVASELRDAGVNTHSTWEQVPGPEDVVAVGNGGSVMFYVPGKSPALIKKIVTVLQQRPATGVVFTRTAMPGTFALEEVMLDSPTAPDVIVVSAWQEATPSAGRAGVDVFNDGYTEYQRGGGMHVSLSPTDLHNLAVAAGPDFRKQHSSELPSGNVDIAPTLLWLMNISPPEPLDGRVLSEALVGAGLPDNPKPARREASAEFPNGQWKQYPKFIELAGVRYLEEANGEWTPLATGLTVTNHENRVHAPRITKPN